MFVVLSLGSDISHFSAFFSFNAAEKYFLLFSRVLVSMLLKIDFFLSNLSIFRPFNVIETWHPPCINTFPSAENGENQKSARIKTQRSKKRHKNWTQVSTGKQTDAQEMMIGKE
jgi:hypothetical protein